MSLTKECQSISRYTIREIVFWVQYCVYLLHNTPFLTSTSEQLNEKTLICTSWHRLDVRCYVNLKVQKCRFKRILCIWVFLEVYCKSTCRYSAKILRCSAKLLKAVLINILERAMQTDDPQKNTAKCSVKLLRYTLQNTKRYSETSWKVFCKTDEKFSAKIVKIGSAKMPICGPQKYCEMFCKNTERCSTEILRRLLREK